MITNQSFGFQRPNLEQHKKTQQAKKQTFSGPPHQPNISFGNLTFGNDAPKAEPAKKTEVKTASAKSSNSGKTVGKIGKWLLALTAGTAAVGGYVDNNNKIGDLRNQNTVLAAQNKDLSAKLDQIKIPNTMGLNDLADLVSKVAPGNVMVRGKYGLGSGTWLQDKNGNLYVLTNHHVVEDNSLRGKDSPPTFEIRLHNGLNTSASTTVEGQLIKLANGQYAESADHDLALIGISTPNFKLPSHIKPLKFRDMKADPLRAGEFVVVVGTPHGLTDNVTHGIISHVDRKLDGFEEANVFIGVDSPINPGNSGGSCYDMQGRYLGPPTAGMRGADGMGFAIRTDVVQDVLKSWGVESN